MPRPVRIKTRRSENDVVSAVREYLELIGCEVIRNNSGSMRNVRFGKIGSADLIACMPPNGKYLAVECKNGPKDKPTEVQLKWLSEITGRGGISIVAWSVDDVKEGLDKYWEDGHC